MVLNGDDFVLTDHHASAGNWIGLICAGHSIQIPLYSCFLGSAVALVVSHSPCHGLLSEYSLDSTWEQNLGISVSQVSYYHTVRGEQEQAVFLLVVISQKLVLGYLYNVAIG